MPRWAGAGDAGGDAKMSQLHAAKDTHAKALAINLEASIYGIARSGVVVVRKTEIVCTQTSWCRKKVW